MRDEILKTFINDRVTICVGNIVAQSVGAVVNAANSTLLGGGGVDGAIHFAGGPKILEECREIRRTQYPDGLPAGKAVITSGGNLPARFVIHTVGPIYGYDENEAALLTDCYRHSLLLAVQHQLQTIAFPAISTGAYSYPRESAAVTASEAIKNFLSNDHALKEVRLVFFKTGDANVFLQNQRFETEE